MEPLLAVVGRRSAGAYHAPCEACPALPLRPQR